VTSKFELSVARRAIYDLLLEIAANYQPPAQQSLMGMMFKDEFDAIHLTDGPSDYSDTNYAKSGTEDWDWAALAYNSATWYGFRLDGIGVTTISAVPSSTWTSVPWSAGNEFFDEGAWWTSGATVTCPADGKYLFLGGVSFRFFGTTSQVGVRIRKTNATADTVDEYLRSYDAVMPSSGAGTEVYATFDVGAMYDCSEDDTFELQVWHNRAAAATADFVNPHFEASLQGVR